MLTILMEAQGQWYGVPAAEVEEITPAMPWRPLPGVPAYIRGVTRYRGSTIPVVDLMSLLHNREAELRLSTRLLIIPLQGSSLPFLALLAEHVLEAVMIPKTAWDENLVAELGPEFLGELSSVESRSVQQIKPLHLIPEALQQAIGFTLSEEGT